MNISDENKAKTQALSYLFETEPPHDEHGTHSRPPPFAVHPQEGRRGARSAFSFENFKKGVSNFRRSRDEETQTKRHTFGARSILPNRLKD